MPYLLDTNAWVALLRDNNAPLANRIKSTPEGEILLCSVVMAELLYGARKSGTSHSKRNLELVARLRDRFRSLAFDDAAGEHWADIRIALERTGVPIGPNDLAIAATARANGVCVVTHNLREFERVPGLAVEDWQVG